MRNATTNSCCETVWSPTSAEECCSECESSAFGFTCVAWEWYEEGLDCYLCSTEVLPHRGYMKGHTTGCLKGNCDNTTANGSREIDLYAVGTTAASGSVKSTSSYFRHPGFIGPTSEQKKYHIVNCSGESECVAVGKNSCDNFSGCQSFGFSLGHRLRVRLGQGHTLSE